MGDTMNTRLLVGSLFLAAYGLLTANLNADVVILNSGVATNIDFESSLTGSNNGAFSGNGFSPGATTVGNLDSNSWSISGFGDNVSFGGSASSGDPARGTATGAVSTGGFYAFDATADGGSIGLGVQPAGSDFTPGDIKLRLRNDTGSEITSFDVGYELRVFNDQPRANSFNFEYSFDDANYTQVPEFNFTSDLAAAATPTWALTTFSSTISGLSLADGSNLYFRWTGNDDGGSGSRDQFQLDNIGITFNAASVPEPASLALFGAVAAGFGFRNRRRRKSI